MNVLILKFPYSSVLGGGEMHTMKMVQELQKRNINFYYLGSCEVLLDEFRKQEIESKSFYIGPEPVTEWSILGFMVLYPLWFLVAFALIAHYRIIKKVDTVYCLSFTEKVLITPIARFFGIKVIWVEHGTFGRWFKLNPFRFAYLIFSKLAQIVTVSNSAKVQLIKCQVNERNIKVIPNGINLDSFIRNTNCGSSRIPGKVTIGVVGRLHQEKGINYLIEAIKIASKTVACIELIIIGGGPEMNKLKTQASQLGLVENVNFVGHQEEINKWLEKFDIYVNSSLRESMPLTVIEAMAVSLPVIATRVGGIPEVVDNGVSGILVPPNDPRSLADAIIKLCNNPRQRKEMGQVGRMIVEQKFSQKEMIDSYETLFKS